MDIINTRGDLDAASSEIRDLVIQQLWAASISADGNRNNKNPFGYTWQELDELCGGMPPMPVIPEPPLPPPITVITVLQAETAIYAAGIADQYQQFVEALPFLERSIWMRQTNWRIDDPLIVKGAAALGLSTEQLQQIFNSAAVEGASNGSI